jgi:hypothetical protein
MTTATTDKIRSGLESLNANMQAARDTIRQPLLDQCAAMVQVQTTLEQDLRQALEEGVERETLRSLLSTARLQLDRNLDSLRKTLALFEGDAVAAPVLEAHLHRTESFRAWVRGLEDRASTPLPPFDESKLPPTPTGPQADGFIRLSTVRAQMEKMP